MTASLKPPEWPDPPWWLCEYCATRKPWGCVQHSAQIVEYEMHGYEPWPITSDSGEPDPSAYE